MSRDAVIVAAKRTAIGRFSGSFSTTPATELGARAIAAVLSQTDIDPTMIDDVLIGQVLQAGAGQNPARQAAIGGGVPISVPAATINQVCGGGQRTLHMAAQAIRASDADVVLVGGQDNMTLAPHVLQRSRAGFKTGNVEMQDSMMVDGLVDAFHGVHMGVTAEILARRYQVTREAQDAFALDSQRKAAAAIAAGLFAEEIVPVDVQVKGGTVRIDADEHPRPQTTAADLAGLKPIFEESGTVTAGNASGLNDGAAALLVMSDERARDLGLEPLVRIAAYASAGVEPMEMGLGPVPASRRALARAGWTTDDLDLIEVNEAFAAQSIAVHLEMGWDVAKANVNGGAIALGHPLAGSGARMVVTLILEMQRRNVRKGLATMCIGGGQGVAICLER
ncbi:acetyl-CoA acetyltransferase [Devosia geojensis]|uniref:Beta-ketothiolase n=1 Tax=Devosia geojensis TaxID=443610 RepID=A0A0F5FR01_9HYPH|nr:acetyl-CoA C-acetyltransferase [Devosia geojensis]KKB11286.1 acetyl-CoA acetyltransferase [Devosia geojensis]